MILCPLYQYLNECLHISYLSQGATIEDVNDGDRKVVDVLGRHVAGGRGQGEPGGHVRVVQGVEPLQDELRGLRHLRVPRTHLQSGENHLPEDRRWQQPQRGSLVIVAEYGGV